MSELVTMKLLEGWRLHREYLFGLIRAKNYSENWGACRPPNPLAALGGPKAPETARPGGKAPQNPLARKRAWYERAAREHEVIMARNMMSNHTDMQRQSPCSKPICKGGGLTAADGTSCSVPL